VYQHAGAAGDKVRKGLDTENLMKLLRLCPFLIAGALAVGQDNSNLFDKAPPPIDEALRARVAQFYGAYTSGKFRDAYSLVAEDSQDAFFAAAKEVFKSCEALRIKYSDDFTKADVLEACKGEWNYHGIKTPTSFPLTSHWKIVDGQWYWYYVKPTSVPSPFSPTGFASMDPSSAADGAAKTIPALPNPMEAARNILSQVKVDKTAITLHGYETSKDELQVTNEMSGQIDLSIDPIAFPGLKITPGKTELQSNEKTTIVFEYRLDDATIECGECAKRVRSTVTTKLHIAPSNQVFPITITFGAPPEAEKQIPKQ
jgi:hypothetical protein